MGIICSLGKRTFFIPSLQNIMLSRIFYTIVTPKNVEQTAQEFKKNLKKKIKNVRLKNPEEGHRKKTRETPSDVYLAFCPVVSDTKTNIDATLKNIKDDKPTILVVLHQTLEKEAVVSKSSTFVERENMLVLDCLFYEGKGLLACKKNEEAYKEAAVWIKSNKKLLQQRRNRSSKKNQKVADDNSSRKQDTSSPDVRSSRNDHNRDERKKRDASKKKTKTCVFL
ncbi:uncharacterized protein isoform X2 [Danio rerio]|uniref:Uncharacterized protein isoform X2 n=1 Tax=Danio rerio TaxID=7955 RepID=A0AC58JL88_DANRE